MWRQREINKLNSLKLSHSHLENEIKRKKEIEESSTNSRESLNTLNLLVQKLDSLEKKVDQIKEQKIVVTNVENNQANINRIEKDNIPMFIPTLNIEDKKINNTEEVITRKRSVDLSSALNQLEVLKGENNI
jgi:hypothetical protein